MASPRGAYTPKSGALAGQSFGSYYQYQNARAQQLGFSGYTEERNFRLEERARANVNRIYPGYPRERMNAVMRNANQRQKADIARFDSMQDAYEWPDSEDVELFYH